MLKVKNSPRNYIKRSQIRPAGVVVDRVAERPKKRTDADFNEAMIDSNFYVSFRADEKIDKQK